MNKYLISILLIIFPIIVVIIASCTEKTEVSPSYEMHTVVRVIDGDTFEIESGETVRLIGVDAPELGSGNKEDEAFAQKVYDRTKTMLEGKEVGFEYDEQRRDENGTLITYVFYQNKYSKKMNIIFTIIY